jgi:hypothetical protein
MRRSSAGGELSWGIVATMQGIPNARAFRGRFSDPLHGTVEPRSPFHFGEAIACFPCNSSPRFEFLYLQLQLLVGPDDDELSSERHLSAQISG